LTWEKVPVNTAPVVSAVIAAGRGPAPEQSGLDPFCPPPIGGVNIPAEWRIAQFHNGRNSPAPGGPAFGIVGRADPVRGETGVPVPTAEDFAELIDPYRGELLAHCYRMLGSVHDAEDLVQETTLRAWRARERYDPARASLRTWLYRIATNACLTALQGRDRRPLPSDLVEASDPAAPLRPGAEVGWLQPFPDALLDPAAAVVARDGLRLAFVAALQVLSARQRAALILREVLDFSAQETAQILDTSTAAVNSALQRARGRLGEARVLPEQVAEPSGAGQRELVDRYVEAFLRADVPALKRLLAEDVLMEMPPMLNWFTGREAYGVFMAWVFADGRTDWRMLPIGANGQPAAAAYVRDPAGGYRLHTVQVFTVGAGGISRISVFQEAAVFAAFRLAPVLAD
jgi:RNA polymerase sigma-70 factor (ECF subfamily)